MGIPEDLCIFGHVRTRLTHESAAQGDLALLDDVARLAPRQLRMALDEGQIEAHLQAHSARVVPGRRILAEVRTEKTIELAVPRAQGQRHLEERLHGYGQELRWLVSAVV